MTFHVFGSCQNGAIEDGAANSNAGTAIVTDLATPRVDEDSTNLAIDAFELFQDRLVEESGILGGEEIYLEDVRIFAKSAQSFSLMTEFSQDVFAKMRLNFHKNEQQFHNNCRQVLQERAVMFEFPPAGKYTCM